MRIHHPGLREGLVLRWDDENVPLEVVGAVARPDTGSGTVTTYGDELAVRRDAPLAACPRPRRRLVGAAARLTRPAQPFDAWRAR